MDENGWRPMDSAPKTKTEPYGRQTQFLAVRCNKIIICWWDDDRYAKVPKPYWNGTDAFMGIRRMRENDPAVWQPLPELPTP